MKIVREAEDAKVFSGLSTSYQIDIIEAEEELSNQLRNH